MRLRSRYYFNVGILIIAIVLGGTSFVLADEWREISYIPITLPSEYDVLYSNESITFDHLRIDSEKDFREFLNYANSGYCKFGHAEIDFSKNTLLGQYTRGGPGDTFEKIITRNDQLKLVKMEVRIKNDRRQYRSAMPRLSLNLVLIPKIPADYEVIFSVEK